MNIPIPPSLCTDTPELPMTDKPKCLRPECERTAKVRGLCTYCYSQASLAVRMGKTTWDELAANGKCLSLKHGHSSSVVQSWLLAKPVNKLKKALP